MLTYPLSSTGQSARSGKVAPPNVVRPPIQAHLQLVFGTRSDGKEAPQGSQIPVVFDPRDGGDICPRADPRRHAGGSGLRQVGSPGEARQGGTGQAKNLALKKGSGNGESPTSAALRQRQRDAVSARRMCRAADMRATSVEAVEARPGRSESRMPARAPVTNLWQAGRKTGQQEARHRARKHALTDARIEGSPDIPQGRSIHTPVRVGSAAMPAPFAMCRPSPLPAFPPSRQGRVAAPFSPDPGRLRPRRRNGSSHFPFGSFPRRSDPAMKC